MSTPPSHDRHLIRSAGTIGAFTALSRVLGFVRDIIIATAFGTGLAAEAFVVSFRIPNLLRDLVGEGATNAAFVPALTECREKSPERFWRLAATLFWVMSGILLVLSLLGVLFAEPIVALIAPGFLHSSDPEKFPLTVKLTRVIFPYIFLIGLSALAMGILNSLKEFKSSAFGPALLNLSLITAGIWFEKDYGPMALIVGVLVGGALQLACQIPPLFRRGFRFFPAGGEKEYTRKIGRLLLPRAFGSALYQINVFVDSILASFESFVGPGGQSALYYANRLFQLPLAIFGLALAQALLPTFSTQMVRRDLDGFRATFVSSVCSLMFIVLPASFGLIVLSKPIIRVLFEHGRFDAYSTSITSSALFFYAFGLLSCCLIKVLVNAFYAMQDTRTPVRTMLIAVAFNIVLSLLLMGPLKIGGLALASTLSATLNGYLLYTRLRRRSGPFDEPRMLRAFWKMALAAGVMAAAVLAYDALVLERLQDVSRVLQGLAMGAGIAAAVAVYFAASLLLRVEEARKIFS